MDQNNYFSTIYKPNFDKYEYSGWELLNKINNLYRIKILGKRPQKSTDLEEYVVLEPKNIV